MARERILRDTVYEFKELSGDGKAKALENLYDINVDYEWWDLAVDNFKEEMEKKGFYIDNFYFGLNPIDGAWTGGINIEEWLDSKKYISKHRELVRHMIERIYYVNVTVVGREVGTMVFGWGVGDVDYDDLMCEKCEDDFEPVDDNNLNVVRCMTCGKKLDMDKEKKVLEEFIEEIEEEATDAAHEMASVLSKEHDYLTSEKSIRETIKANEYEFYEDGSLI